MTFKIKISKFGILLIVLIVVVYTIWFVFFQDVIQFILENAISTETGERDIITGWIGVFFLPLLIVVGILGITGFILYLINKMKGKEIS